TAPGGPAPQGGVGPRGGAAQPPAGGAPGQPAGPTTDATGEMPLLPPEFRMDNESPQPPGPPSVLAPPPGAQYGGHSEPGRPGPGAPVSGGGPRSGIGDTTPGGIPAVPPRSGSPDEPLGDPEPPAPRAESPAPKPAPKAPAKKGRSKLTLLGVAAAGVIGVAYGAGLLMNHADIPNGTTVLGVDIGGATREEAVAALEKEIGDRATAPLTVEIGGTEHALKPSVAGLSFDTETTVGNASGREYNPVSVIGSLFGGEHPAEPVFTVDEEKLRAVLADLGGEGGTSQDGMITFEGGKPVVVKGEPRQAVDAASAAKTVEAAYRERAAGGTDQVISLPVGEQQPKVTDAEFDRALKEFAEPAMSGLVTVRAGAKEISFSPERSLPKFLSMRANPSGKLVDHYDLEALEELYGGFFDGVLVARGDGSRTPVTPQDVAGALRTALLETDPAKRVGVIELNAE
ncbi:hypothetical protein, partial [Streptomyces sp. JJ38]|uniref:hypothetical protein n=1 Tax=Streptomyces sp. JJ38 TaxID=2738128 RepID=UPI001C563090